jgi:hypothetical protein
VIQTAITVELNDHWLKNFYFGHLCLQKYKNDICIDLYYGIHCFFRHSNFIMNQIAHSFYNNQGTKHNTQSSIAVQIGTRNCCPSTPTAMKIWILTPTSSTFAKTKGS